MIVDATTASIAALLFLGAILYTSVGHAGSSIYVAIMSFFSLQATTIKPTALVLNILVSTFTSVRFIKAKLVDFSLLLPLLIGAIPLAFVGGAIDLPSELYKSIIGMLLLISGFTFLLRKQSDDSKQTKHPHAVVSVLLGAAIGFTAGITGTGGGIFLSPIVLFLSWTTVKKTSGTAAVFILCNSISGLLGHISSVSSVPNEVFVYAVAVLAGAVIGTQFGIRRFSNEGVKKALGVVLLIAGAKLALGA
jgi:uncharacterized membrane protein YfcA